MFGEIRLRYRTASSQHKTQVPFEIELEERLTILVFKAYSLIKHISHYNTNT